MESLIRKYQWHAYWVVIGVTCITLLAYTLPKKKLYLNTNVRANAVMLLEKNSQKYGLPISDFFFTYVGWYDFRLCRRLHGRGKDPVHCDWFSVRSIPR